jgi:glutamate carboxypeptidase
MTDDARRLLDWTSAQQTWVRQTIEALVRLESPSEDKAAVDRCGLELASRLESIGARVETIEQSQRGDHIRASVGDGPAQILLLGHFDTVWRVGEIERMPVHEKDGRLYGPGVFDMKAGIALAMLATRALFAMAAASLPPRVVMLWTTDEEIGSETSRALIEEEALRSRAVLVLEPSLPGGAVKTSRKGCGDFELIVHGVAAHAGIDPRQGASAIHELVLQVAAIQRLQDLDRGISVNVGLIRGGTRTNVVAERAQASIDIRVPMMKDAEDVERALRNLRPYSSRTRLDLSGCFSRPPLERTDQVERLYALARDAAAEFGVALGEGATGGGSDGNFTAALGVPTLDGLGPKGDGAHALHEHVVVDDLAWRAAFLARLMGRLTEVE